MTNERSLPFWKYENNCRHFAPQEPHISALELQQYVRNSELLFKPDRRGYYIGEKVKSQVHGIDGEIIGNETFTIEQSPGSGFAGQVYRASPESGVIYEAGKKAGNAPVAIKVLRPKSRFKEAFRDILFRLCFQAAFAPRFREEALRSGLIWQKLLRIAAGIEIGTESAITKPYGYYWDDENKSFTEIHEWIEARSPRYEADDQILTRVFRRDVHPTNSEMRRKKHFMSEMVKLCNQIGASGIARQYEWYTFVAQANVLTRRNPTEGQSEFVVVDTRPGLAVPFFLPLSPAHLIIILHGLKSGVFTHFDEVDFRRLDKYLATHTEAFAPVDGLIQQLRKDNECYRNGLPNLWHTRTRIVRDAAFRWSVQASTISDWRKLDHISKKKAEQLKDGSSRFLSYLMLDNIPLVGKPLLRLAGNEHYRHYLKNMVSDSTCLAETIEVHRASDLIEWTDSGRVSETRADTLSKSVLYYARDKVGLSWLPAGLHRLRTDKERRKQFIRDVFIDPVRLFINTEFRKEWLEEIIEQQCERGIVSTKEAAKLREQANDSWTRGFLQDLGFTIGLGVAAAPIYAALTAYGISTGNYLPLVFAFGPISPSGVVREAYVLAQLARELPKILKNKNAKLLAARGVGLATAPWRAVGNLFPVLEMFAYYSDMSLLLGDYFVQNMTDKIPVFGGEGKLLAYWTFNTAYNLPLSIISVFRVQIER